MLDEAAALPDDPGDLRSLAERPIAEVKAQAVPIEKLRHRLAGDPGAPVRGLRGRRPISCSWRSR